MAPALNPYLNPYRSSVSLHVVVLTEPHDNELLCGTNPRGLLDHRRWPLAKFEEVACPTGVGRAITAYRMPIEGRDEWLAAARRMA